MGFTLERELELLKDHQFIMLISILILGIECLGKVCITTVLSIGKFISSMLTLTSKI